MSAALETLSPSKGSITTPPLMEKNEQIEEKKTNNSAQHGVEESNSKRTNMNADERDEKDAMLKIGKILTPPQMNKDKESLSTPKKKSAGNLAVNKIGDSKEADVKILSLSIISPGRSDIVLSDPFASSPKACLFTLKEGSKYRIKFSFTVSNNTVYGLQYISTVWKSGVRVDKSTVLLGSTFRPRQQPYHYELEEDTTPTGVFVRGLYSARIKVVDDESNCHFDIKYYFDIQKHW